MSSTHDCGGDAAAYLLGALEPSEAEAFQRHLDSCVVCRDEIEALQGAVDALPMAALQLPVSRRLRRRVMRGIRAEPRVLTGRPRARADRGWSARPVRLATAVMASAGVIAGGTLAGLELSPGNDTGRVIQASVTGIRGSAHLLVSHARGELLVRHLSPPPPGHVYEVWLKSPGAAPVPASVLFSVGHNGGADVGLPGSLRGVSQVMVTPEPSGGSPAPTHAPVIVATLS